jgi:hypothetical protein
MQPFSAVRLTITTQADGRSLIKCSSSPMEVHPLDVVVQLTRRWLDPAVTNESGALFVGDLIAGMIRKGGAAIEPALPPLLTAVIRRLDGPSSKSTTFVQSMVMVFAHVIVRQPEMVLQFLQQKISDNTTGLHVLLAAWAEHADAFHGDFNLKMSCMALTKLLLASSQMQNRALHQIVVKGDLVIPIQQQLGGEGLIITRSRSRKTPDQWTQIPFTAKAFKLLLADLKERASGNNNSVDASFNYDEEDKDDGENYEDGEDDGDEWEDSGAVGGGCNSAEKRYLSELLDFGADGNDFDDNNEGDNEDSEDLKDDPIYQMDMQKYLVEFLRQAYGQNLCDFTQCMDFLSSAERETLHRIVA